jgi:hypothetical protein
VVTVAGDPNTDNKRCLSNFGNVIAAPYADLPLVRRLPRQAKDLRIDVVPRAWGRWFVSLADVAHAESLPVEPGREVVDQFRIRRRRTLTEHAGHVHESPEFRARRPCPGGERESRSERRPDPLGHYPTDPDALPPGLKDVPLITIAHIVNGRPIGGFTWAIRERQ